MFRFTIRDVLWLTAVVALGVAWWIHYRLASPQSQARRERDLLLGFIEARQYQVDFQDDAIWINHPNAEYRLEYGSRNDRMFKHPYNESRTPLP